jgi:hypothetical protein
MVDWNCVVRRATRYGLNNPRIETRWRPGFPHPSRPNLRPIQPRTERVQGTSSGSKAVEAGRGVIHPPPPILSPSWPIVGRNLLSAYLQLYNSICTSVGIHVVVYSVQSCSTRIIKINFAAEQIRNSSRAVRSPLVPCCMPCLDFQPEPYSNYVICKLINLRLRVRAGALQFPV